jgi:adenylate kinase family enzyme
MRQLTYLILITVLIYSCSNKTSSNEAGKSINSSNNASLRFKNAIEKAVKIFPDDSASICQFYYEWFPAKDNKELDEQSERLEILTSQEYVDRYNEVNNKLKQLLLEITTRKSLSKSQADILVKLYSDYDYFTGEALFSQLLTNDEIYGLVWETFKIMSNESKKDTCFISALIKLENNIMTNAELGEAMPDFIVKAIQNNPYGFLEMYKQREEGQKKDFSQYISVFDEPDKKLIEVYTDISKKSVNEVYRKLAKELINNINNTGSTTKGT